MNKKILIAIPARYGSSRLPGKPLIKLNGKEMLLRVYENAKTVANKYPEMTFVMKSYKGDEEEGTMIGDLTIRGVTKEVKLDVEIGGTIKDFEGNNRVGFSIYGKINRLDYGLKWNKALELGGFAVGDKVKIIVEVEAVEL